MAFSRTQKTIRIPHIKEKLQNISVQEFWIITIILFVCINILSIVFAFLFFLKVSHDPVGAHTVQPPITQTINREQLQKVLSGFEQRRMDFEAKKAIRPQIKNPLE